MVVSIEKGAKNISEKFFYDFDDFDTDVLNRVGFDVHGLIEMDLLKRSSTEIIDWQGKKKLKWQLENVLVTFDTRNANTKTTCHIE